jgi:2-keto-4-pentenoate hydratase
MTEAEMIAALADGQRRGTHIVDPTPYATLDRAAANRIQIGVLDAVGAKIGMLKTAVQSDGVGVASPIYASNVGRTGMRLPRANVLGLEVEVGLVLGKDVGPETDVAGAVDHYFTGIEIVGSRFTNRTAAGPNGGLADNMSGLGYVIGGEPRALKDKIDGLTVTLEFAGKQIYSAPAKHGFGTVLASVVAYAKSQLPRLPLKAGTIITTGSLCGLVLTEGAGHAVARLGDDVVEFDLV